MTANNTLEPAADTSEHLRARIAALDVEHGARLAALREREEAFDRGEATADDVASAQSALDAVAGAISRTGASLSEVEVQEGEQAAVAKRAAWLAALAEAASEAREAADEAESGFQRACRAVVGPLGEVVAAVVRQGAARERFLAIAARGGVPTNRQNDPGQDQAARALAAELADDGVDLSAVRLSWGDYRSPAPFRECWSMTEAGTVADAALHALVGDMVLALRKATH